MHTGISSLEVKDEHKRKGLIETSRQILKKLGEILFILFLQASRNLTTLPGGFIVCFLKPSFGL